MCVFADRQSFSRGECVMLSVCFEGTVEGLGISVPPGIQKSWLEARLVTLISYTGR